MPVVAIDVVLDFGSKFFDTPECSTPDGPFGDDAKSDGPGLDPDVCELAERDRGALRPCEEFLSEQFPRPYAQGAPEENLPLPHTTQPPQFELRVPTACI